MPQKRRSGGAAAAASSKSQSTLAFHGAKTNRVTKPGLVPSGANKGTSPNSNKLKSRTASPAPTAAVPSPKDDLESQPQEEEATAEADDEDPKTEDAATTAPPKLSEEDERALSLPEAKIKAYWAGKEKQRAAPRVHQQGLGLHEKVLREFDISGQYGVSSICSPTPDFTSFSIAFPSLAQL